MTTHGIGLLGTILLPCALVSQDLFLPAAPLGPGISNVQRAWCNDVGQDGARELLLASEDGVNGKVVTVSIGPTGALSYQHTLAEEGLTLSMFVADMDLDGYPDIVRHVREPYEPGQPAEQALVIHWGNVIGTYPERTVITAGVPNTLKAVADVTGDGVPEIIGRDHFSTLICGLALGDNSLIPLASHGQGPQGVYIVDMDGDGISEVVVHTTSNIEDNHLWIWNHLNGGMWSTLHGPQGFYGPMDFGDVDHDGSMDVFVYYSNSGMHAIWQGHPDQTLSYPVLVSVSGHHDGRPLLSDLDGDGTMDVLRHHNGAMTRHSITADFQTGPAESLFQVPGSILHFGMTDLNDDGLVDCALVTDHAQAYVVWGTEVPGHFGPPVLMLQWTNGDISSPTSFLQDGHLELAILSNGARTLFQTMPIDTTAIPPISFSMDLGNSAPVTSSRSLLLAYDWDGDGDADILGMDHGHGLFNACGLFAMERTDNDFIRHCLAQTLDPPFLSLNALILDRLGTMDTDRNGVPELYGAGTWRDLNSPPASSQPVNISLSPNSAPFDLGTFAPPLLVSPEFHMRDLDGDGILDIYAAGPSEFDVRFGSGNGQYGPLTQLPFASDLPGHPNEWHDLDGDGMDEVTWTELDNGLYRVRYRVWSSGGYGPAQTFFEQPMPGMDAKSWLVDLDGDGPLDVMFAYRELNNGYQYHLSCHRQVDLPITSDGQVLSNGPRWQWILLDIDSDGDLDLVMALYSGPLIQVRYNIGVGLGLEGSMPPMTGLDLFPNPVSDGLLQLDLSATSPERTTIEVFDGIGRRVLSTATNTVRSTLDVSALAPGPYVARAFPTEGNGPAHQGRFIVLRKD